MINRCAVLLRPKQPFFDWLRSLPDPIEITADTYREDSTVYLLPDYEEEDKDALLAIFCDLLFEEALEGWWTAEQDWPQDRSLELFKEWFDCEFHSVVEDLVDAPLEDEDI